MTTITITTDKVRLTLIGGAEFADKHAGQTYELGGYDNDGWAYSIDGDCFDPAIVTEN